MSHARLAGLVAAAGTGLAFTIALSAQAPTGPRTHRFSANELATPGEQKPNPPKIVPQPDGVSLAVPPGFTATLYASGGFKRARNIAQAPNGDVFVVDSGAGTIWALRDANGNGTIEDTERSEFATGLNQPFGIAFQRGALYVAATDQVVKYPYARGDLKATAAAAVIAPLPNGKAGHWTRNIAFTPDGRHFYVTVGSSHNIDPDPDPLRATVLRFKADGTGREVVSTGVRNAVGIAVHPTTREVWMTVQERDGLGDDLVHDYAAKAVPGRFYGWPWAYLGAHEDPRHAGARPDLVKKTQVPELLFEPHASAMTMVFYGGKAFPAHYRTGAFAALRGSSGRAPRTGYKIVYLPFVKGQSTGAYEDFVTGWMLDENKPEVWGRPVGLTETTDGSLLVVEDGNGTIWKITYKG
ncbi:MAG: PQQ-dependent sugar dehydrogenase [Acidobacteria bacterium]|nr:PQQ-dependent sugar dehydrogenase [Acidobacteriota bacterium]